MKVSSLFNLIRDASDLLDFFENVESPEQLVSRLERLKRQAPGNLLSCIEELRNSVDESLDDTLEMSAAEPDAVDDAPEKEEAPLADSDLDRIIGEIEKQNPAPATPAEDEKIVPP